MPQPAISGYASRLREAFGPGASIGRLRTKSYPSPTGREIRGIRISARCSDELILPKVPCVGLWLSSCKYPVQPMV
jgi:hypothetical protein